MKHAYHRLLRRQLKKAGLENQTDPKFKEFLHQINQAYYEFSSDYSHLENILEKSSQELYRANRKLRNNVEAITGKLENVANNIQEIIFEIDMDGNWVYLNNAWEKWTGYKVADSLGRPFTDFIKKVTLKDKIALGRLQEANFEKLHQIVELETKIGDSKWLDISVKRIFDQDDHPIGHIGTIIDITAQKEVQLELIKAKDKEMKANRAKDEFLSTISHEIRTPLNAVIGISHLLLLEDPKKSQIENLTALNYSSEHLLGLVNDILDFNKIETGNLELEHRIFSIANICESVKSTFGRMAEEKEIGFFFEKDSKIPESLIGDPIRISQVITNLVGNAIKFTDNGEVRVSLKCLKRQKDTLTLEFKVMDSGIGIAPHKQDTIFDAFVQANSDTTRKYGGSGLGLAISKKLLEIMGGTIALESTLGKGSIFSFVLDLQVPQKDSTNIDSGENRTTFSKLEDVSVLVVEDHKLNILVIKKFLSRWNVNFDIAENGKIAVEKAEKKNYDFILMDLQMPVMNGFEATERIRQSDNPNNKKVPIIALSASAAVDVQQELEKYGMDGHISKPFDPGELYKTLKGIKPLAQIS